jgi:O-antigen ligase
MIYLLSLILFLAPFYIFKFSVFSIPTTVLEILIYLALLVRLLVWIKDKRAPKLPSWPFLLAIGAFIVAAGISIYTAKDRTIALGIFKGWIIDPIIFFFLVYDALKTKRDVIILATSFIASALWVGLWALLQYFGVVSLLFYQKQDPGSFLPYLEQKRIFGPFNSPNFLAMYLLPAFIFCLAIYREIKNTWYLGLAAFVLLILILSLSYGAWLAMGTTLILLLILEKRWRQWLLLIVLAGAILLVTQWHSPKFTQLFNWQNRSTTLSRWQIWQTSGLIIKDYPVLGIGLGQFPGAYNKYIGKIAFPPLEWSPPQPHNLYLALLINMGILGLVSFMGLVILGLWRFWKNPYLWFIAPLFALLVHGLIDTPYFKNDLSLIFWFLIGIAAISGVKGVKHENRH